MSITTESSNICESLSTDITKVGENLESLSTKQSIADMIHNHSPFRDKIHPHLSRIVNHITTVERLRTSKEVIKLLQDIIDQSVASILVKCWKMQSIKPRLDAMMKLAVPFLCTPIMTSMLNIGESLSPSSTTLDRTKKCIVDIFTFFINYELSLSKNGGDKSCQVDRVDLCISLLVSKCSRYSPLAVTLREYIFPLLQGLSMHALGVTALCSDIADAISVLSHQLGMIVLGENKGSQSTQSATDAFSTHVIGIQMKALQGLSPYINDYFNWLIDHKKPFVKLCRALEVVEYVHPALRKSLQNEEFSSPSDIIRKYKAKYKYHLTDMPLPIQVFQREDIVQATKDVTRENFLLNDVAHHGNDIVKTMLEILKDQFMLIETREICTRVVGAQRDIASLADSSHQVEKIKNAKKPDATIRDDISTNFLSDSNSHPFIEFIELLSRFLLIAASRTLSSGDAFIILNDLFGGEGLIFTPVALNQSNRGDIKIRISALLISVECSQVFDLVSSTQLAKCKDKQHLAPIISFEVKVVTQFKFGDALHDFLGISTPEGCIDDNAKFQHSLYCYLFILLSSDPEKVCRRLLSIKPLFEKHELK